MIIDFVKKKCNMGEQSICNEIKYELYCNIPEIFKFL